MNKEEALKLPKYTPNPLFAGLPARLKDPKNFNKIQKTLLECLAGQHSHSEMTDWSKCITCQNKAANLRNKINSLGFTSSKQYYEWKKIMDIMVNHKRIPLR